MTGPITNDLFSHANVNSQTVKTDPVKDLKEKTMNAARNGCECPTCGQYVKIYKRVMTTTMCRQLILAYNTFGVGKTFHVRHLVIGTGIGDFPKFEYWGLIEPVTTEDDGKEKRTSGQWKLTPSAGAFIKNEIKMPKYAIVYNRKCLGLESPQISIVDALGHNFNYSELMKERIDTKYVPKV